MISTTITKTNGKNKVIDFRDNLVVANLDDYANMHGTGGKNHAPNSTIRCTVCDYTKGTGENSVTVGVNLSVDVIYKLYYAAKSQILNAGRANEPKITGEGVNELKKIYSGLKNIYAAMSKEGKIDIKTITALGTSAGNALKSISLADVGDFSHQQEKVDVYHKTPDGKAPVSKLVISRQGTRKDGQKSNYPWYISIINGNAPYTEREGGATTYDAKKLSVTGEAFINVSDADMFRMMQKIVSYIRVWENTLCIPLVKQGLQQREQDRLDAANAKN